MNHRRGRARGEKALYVKPNPTSETVRNSHGTRLMGTRSRRIPGPARQDLQVGPPSDAGPAIAARWPDEAGHNRWSNDQGPRHHLPHALCAGRDPQARPLGPRGLRDRQLRPLPRLPLQVRAPGVRDPVAPLRAGGLRGSSRRAGGCASDRDDRPDVRGRLLPLATRGRAWASRPAVRRRLRDAFAATRQDALLGLGDRARARCPALADGHQSGRPARGDPESSPSTSRGRCSPAAASRC